MANYNRWYSETYETILEDMCKWNEFSADLKKKIVCIFAWMPQTIMNVTHSGKGEERETKATVYSLDTVEKEMEKLGEVSGFFKEKHLINTDLDSHSVKERIESLCKPIFEIFGPSAGSKLLHFSYPSFFIMWDSDLRKDQGCDNSPSGYLEYLKKAKAALKNERTIKAAKNEHSNLIRGLDVYWMKEMRRKQ